ncbi:MAG: manganese efflux pump MntP [Acidimicrobiales bacterium]
MLKLLLVALSVGMSNFAASVGLSLRGVDAALRLRVALLFGLFEGGMPVVGLIIGSDLAGSLGGDSRYIGGGLLIATGAYTAFSKGGGEPSRRTGRLALSALALSIDNLVVGFAMGTLKVPMPVAAIIIAAVSVGLSLIGLEIGARLGRRVERYGEEIGGAVLALVGILILTRVMG